MQHPRKTHPIVLAGFSVLVACGLAFGASVDISVGDRDQDSGLQGIRSYGPGAVRQVQPSASDPEAPAASSSTRAAVGSRISGTSTLGSVNVFALSPDGATAVYIADHDSSGLFELYSVAVDGSAAMPTKISSGLTFGAGDTGVALFQIVPDGSQVVFLADAGSGGGVNDVYSVPTDGSLAAVRLNTVAQAPVLAAGVAPNGIAVAFFGSDTAFGGGSTEVYKATVGVAGSAVQLSDASASVPGNVVAADFSPDSATLAYAADSASLGVLQWHGVAISSGGPGSDVVLSDALGSVNLGSVSPDSSTLVYAADENISGVAELFSVPLGGGSSTQLNPSMAGFGVVSVQISGDSARVAYLADQMTSGVIEVFGAQIGSAGSGLRINTALSGTQSADVVTIGPDDATVLYEADENIAGTFDLLTAPIDATVAPSTLDPMTPPSSAGFFPGRGTPVIGGRAVYPVVGSAVDLYSIPFGGNQSSTQINAGLAEGDTVTGVFLPDSAVRLTAYGVGLNGGITEEIHAVPIRADLSAEQVNASAGAGSLGVLDFAIASDEVYLVYLQDQDTTGKAELYSVELDSDGDGIGNATDNCPFVDNVEQTGVPFGQTVRAADSTTFNWNSSADARYVRGPLASVATLAASVSGTLTEASSLIDVDQPTAGAGFFYLFAADCAGRSYQTVLGAEPGRDSAGLP
jgi:Tol biopolymer transport system component